MAQTSTGLRMGAGVAAAAVALGVVQLSAAFFSPAADARTAVGTAVINATPGPVKEWAILTFGTADKLFLSVAVIAVIGVLAAVAAIWERSRVPVGSVAFLLAAAAGSAAVLARPGARPVDIIPTLLGAVCGIAVLRLLTSGRIADDRAADTPDEARMDPGRRLSLATLGFAGLGLLGGVAGVVITRRLHSVSGDRDTFALPSAAPPSPVPADVTPNGVQLPSFITSNADFYRIDTALSVPQLSRADFRLRIHGMVDREITYTFDDLKKFEPIEKVVTLTCVSNPVGGDLISNATWTGYRVRDLLRDSGIHTDADMVLSTSVDGFTAGTPVEALTDGRDAILAIGMNGVPLPVEHGYPARLVVPGLYGYVSATKWVVDLELTRFDRVQAYWTKLGWSERGPIKTESRIDVPRDSQKVAKGPVTFGGVAWAQNRGVKAVEVRIDDGPWQPAQLGAAYSNDTWRLWSFPWTASQSGVHTITVRATDNTGAVQTQAQALPAPDGATGWHSVSFEVA
ncbi:molybdopterin-dependent oxidoreductase [Mycolicibacterium aichiense]|uniref:Oxidoreductase n=1 Tax=Mycolicibacterium aichiense TaxID=1799 RepID=A0AAD1MBR6_9MYCO|nr:molybdopterin-dependent oxidoreductase [Mycolicibacterium aichiense]MCV7019771.1 molybdopterin-dependent oxidoreductase [Mycolicibacterium aichiense]BBX06855.1 oxidoreductase [Mycolicibacterium aichiense]STZ80671.1 sulfite oxidase-like oxidoreductase [Mycolicibacterium aichiense]